MASFANDRKAENNMRQLNRLHFVGFLKYGHLLWRSPPSSPGAANARLIFYKFHPPKPTL